MKRCSQCGQTYDDATLNFCLTDGAPLVDALSSSRYNIAAPPINQPNPLAAILKYGAIAVLAMVFAGVVVAFLYERSKNNQPPDNKNEVAVANQKSAITNTAPVPTPSVVRNLPIATNTGNTNTAPIRSNTAANMAAASNMMMNANVAPKGNKFKIINTSDGYTTVRASPTTSSAAKGSLYPGTEIVCEGIAAGEKFDGSTTWRYCPAVGGYVHSKLLMLVN